MSRLKKLASLTGIVAIGLLTVPQASAKDLKVVSTFSIISDFAKNVGADRIAVTTLVEPNGDAHAYEPRPADAAAIRNADVVLANGLHFEGFLPRLVKASGTKAPVVELTKDAKLLRTSQNEHDSHDDDNHGEYDPHAWQSVHNAQIYVNNIADAFCAADEAGCQSYRTNAASYGEKLKALETDLKATMAQIPSDKRTIITSHEAFTYLGHEYGLQLLAPQGASTGSEASAADIAALIRQVKQANASALFLENVSNPRLLEQIARETGMKVGGKLYSDALSAEDGSAATYIDMMRHNVNTIRNAALQG